MMTVVYIGLGSNVDNPMQQIQQALTTIDTHADITIEAVSSLYGNPPMGPADQPDFVNAVAKLVTSISPLELLLFLQNIEQKQNRKKKMKWGPRTIDVDILLYGNEIIDLPHLVIPHQGLSQRAFVVLPLLEIAPNLRLPNHILLKNVIKNIDCSLLVKIK